MTLTREDWYTLLGANPRMAAQDWNPPDDDANYALQGSQQSGSVMGIYPQGSVSLANYPRYGLLKCKKMQPTPGLASVMINTYTQRAVSGDSGPNQKMIAYVSWQNMNAGGNAIIDCSKGCLFTLSGSTSVDIDVQIVPTDTGAAFGALGQGYYIKNVEATVNWVGSVNPVKAMYTSDTIHLVSGVPSSVVAIPDFAHSVMAISDTPASLGVLTLDFLNGNIGTPSTRFSTLNPNSNGTPICAGAEYVRMTSAGVNQSVILVFELWL